MLRIQEVKTTPSLELFSELVELLQDAVSSGAAMGYVKPPSTKSARNYWAQVLEAVGRGERRLFVATDEHVCAGSVQLALAPMENAVHRGELQKLMVHTQFRRRGIGRALLAALESAAVAQSLTLLVLDTREGDAAEVLYQKAGWQRAGSIPGFARSSDGSLHATVVYYRALAEGAA